MNEKDRTIGSGQRDGGSPEAGVAADRARIEAYLGGDDRVFQEVESWIRCEIELRHAILHNDIEDLCQSVHVKLVTNLRAGRFRGGSSLRTYVAGIARYTAIDQIRRLYRDRVVFPGAEGSEASTQENPYSSLAALQEEQIFFLAVRGVPESCRELWRMIFLDRLSYDEIGRRLSIPAGTVKSRMWYCRRKVLDLVERLKQGRGSKPKRPRQS